VHDDTDSQLPLWFSVAREASVVFGQELIEEGDHTVKQERLRYLVNWMNERQYAVTAVDEPVTMARVDARIA
jgi:hypothetical protein